MIEASKRAYGTVSKEITKLLTAPRKKPLSYDQIADRVKAKIPGAKTTPRSVASIASTLRSAGVEIPDHRSLRSQFA